MSPMLSASEIRSSITAPSHPRARQDWGRCYRSAFRRTTHNRLQRQRRRPFAMTYMRSLTPSVYRSVRPILRVLARH